MMRHVQNIIRVKNLEELLSQEKREKRIRFHKTTSMNGSKDVR